MKDISLCAYSQAGWMVGDTHQFPFAASMGFAKGSTQPARSIGPGGQISDLPVQPPSQKYSDFPKTQISFISLAIPCPPRGAYRDRHGRGARDAMDANCRAQSFARTSGVLRTAKSCGPDAPMLASSLRQHPQATVATKPGHRGEREISRKTIARGRPVDSVEPVVLPPCFFCTGPMGAIGARPSLRPLVSRGWFA